mmetsp:Transcript_53119/g.84506  ORF Transcript_53119/g.84506 Transcript_53119/m.84506 type:complete len:591 (+) Transcript_53119:81-1853(+)
MRSSRSMPPNKGRGSSRIEDKSGGREAIDAYRSFTTLVMDTARRTSSCLQDLMNLHRGLLKGVHAFLAHDSVVIDDSAMTIVAELSTALEKVSGAINLTLMKHVEEAGQDILTELDRITEVLRVWGEAVEEQEHYEGKVESLEKQRTSGSERLSRNKDKLVLAKNNVAVKKGEGDAELALFSEKRSVMVRATLICFLRLYMPMLVRLGTDYTPIAQQCLAEVEQGARVEIAGLKKARTLNGQICTIESAENDGKRCRVLLSNGEQKSVRMENLIPCACHTPGLQGRGGVVERASSAEGSASERERPQYDAEEPEDISDDPPVRERSRWLSSAEETLTEAPRIGFGQVGRNIELLRVRGGGAAAFSWLPVIAARPEGLLHGVSFTAERLTALAPSVHACRGSHRYYFELLVLEATSSGTVRSISLGFAWPPASASEETPADDWNGKSFATSVASFATTESDAEQLRRNFSLGAEVLAGRSLPESSRELPYGFCVGGEPCKSFLAGQETARISGWRPVKDVSSGTRLGCLLEQDASNLRLNIFQDGVHRCKAEVASPAWAAGAPYGIIDVCGSVRKVQLLQEQTPPEADLEC